MKKTLFAITLLCGALMLGAATVHNIDNFRKADGTPLVVPQPQKYEAKSGVFQLPETLTVEAPASEKIIFEYLGKELKRFSRTVVPAKDAAQCRFVLTEDGVPENKEGYTLEITSGGITIKARTTDGLFYGAVTLCNLLRNAAKPELDCCFITDWPSLPYRNYTLRISNVPPSKLGQLKKLIDVMARFKFNSVFLEVSEAFPYKSEEFVKAKYHHSREDMIEFRDYCRARHVKIVPSIQVLSHNLWLTYHADWEKMKEGEPNKPWNSQPCIQNEEARRITMNCLREQIEFFDPEILYIYTDEIVLGPFRQCPRCKDVPVMTLLADYMKYLREGLKDFKGRLLFSNDSFYSEHNPKWPWGDEFRKYLDPKRDIIGYWDYRDELRENGIAPFKDFVTFGTCITGKPLNVQCMAKMITKYKGEGVRMTHWYFSHGGSYTNFKAETPDSIGGFPQGAEYIWNLRDTYHAEFTYDGVYEMLRSLRPELTNDALVREEATSLPINRSVNAELSGSGLFPKLDDARVAELKKILAARPEHFNLLTAPGGRYYGMRVTGDKRDNGRGGIAFSTFERKFKTVSLLTTTSRPYNIVDYLSICVYGKNRFETPEVAKLIFAYADGKKITVPLCFRKDLTDWGQIQGGVNMRWAARGIDLEDRYYSFGVRDVANPRPDVPVKNLIFTTMHHDGISPVILAVSLKGANKPFPKPAGKFDPAKIAKPYPAGRIDPLATGTKLHYDFKNGIPKDLRFDFQGKFTDKVKTEVVDDPERGKVLKITVPPAQPTHADGYVRINISMPFKYDKKMRGMISMMRVVAEPGDYRNVMEYLNTRLITASLDSPGDYRSYATKAIGPKWSLMSNRYDKKPNEVTMNKISDAHTRRICVYFHKVTKPAEIYLDAIGELMIDYDLLPDWTVGHEREQHP